MTDPSKCIVGKVIDGELPGEVYVRVPVLFDGLLPDVPKVITGGSGLVAVLISTNPLTYQVHEAPQLVEILNVV